jgi:DNA gyrase subunit A
MGASGAQKLYKTGHGSVVMRAKCHVELIAGATSAKGNTKARNAIVVTELPYMTNKASKYFPE